MLPSPIPLAPPGAGIPWWHRCAGRFSLRQYSRRTGWEQACRHFFKEGERLQSLVAPLDPARFTTPVLVPPMIGLEDSSRFWSPAMVLEHLMIVGERITTAIVQLSQGVVPQDKVSTAEVKPSGTPDPTRLREDFRAFLQQFRATLETSVADRSSRARFAHPWFGPLTAHQWLCLQG